MPATAPQIPRRHAENREAAARDMANVLLMDAVAARHPELVEAAIEHACQLIEGNGDWLTLGRRAGHYRKPGAAPASDTISDTIALLESMRPDPDADDSDLWEVPA